jgi:hypothetical protein
MSNDPVYLKRSQAATYIRQEWGLPCSATALARLAQSGCGPRYQNLDDRFAIYRPADLDHWARSRISKPLRSDAAFSDSSTRRRARTCHGV